MMYISYIGRCIYLCVLVLHKVCYNNFSRCNVITSISSSDSVLPSGRWSSEGCTTMVHNNGSITCQCSHLTHFAILLSPGVVVSTIHYVLLHTIC